MRRPSIKCGAYSISYDQVPYNNRYYIIAFKEGPHKVNWRLPCTERWMAELLLEGLLNRSSRASIPIRQAKVRNFFNRCRAYDEWLDAQPEPSW